MTNEVRPGQTFINKVIELTGDIENAFEMMQLNGLESIASGVIPGTKVKTSAVTDFEVVEYFIDKLPATGFEIRIKTVQVNDYLLPGLLPYSL